MVVVPVLIRPDRRVSCLDHSLGMACWPSTARLPRGLLATSTSHIKKTKTEFLIICRLFFLSSVKCFVGWFVYVGCLLVQPVLCFRQDEGFVNYVSLSGLNTRSMIWYAIIFWNSAPLPSSPRLFFLQTFPLSLPQKYPAHSFPLRFLFIFQKRGGAAIGRLCYCASLP